MTSEERKQMDLAMMRDPDRWPAWPLLPLKRYVPGKPIAETACLARLGKDQYVLAMGVNVFQGPDDQTEWVRTTPEQLVEQGWMVDAPAHSLHLP
jgi:hypothetical protein